MTAQRWRGEEPSLGQNDVPPLWGYISWQCTDVCLRGEIAVIP